MILENKKEGTAYFVQAIHLFLFMLKQLKEHVIIVTHLFDKDKTLCRENMELFDFSVMNI